MKEKYNYKSESEKFQTLNDWKDYSDFKEKLKKKYFSELSFPNLKLEDRKK